MSRDVFISYKTEDKDAAERLCAALERESISCWMAPRDIPPGQEWAASIVAGLQRSRSFVLLLSSHSTTARQIAREAELADKQNLPIMTFRLEDVQPPNELLYFLGNLQWLDAFGGQFDAAAARLANVIRNSPNYPAPESTIRIPPHRESVAAPPPASTPPAPPPPAKRNLLPIAAGLIALLVLAVWFVLRRSPEVDTMQEAKTVAERFLNERDSGNYDDAWNEYTASFHNRENRNVWQRDLEKRAANTGGISQHTFKVCKSSETGVYVCEYTLLYKNGSQAQNDLWVVKSDKGGWAIDKGTIVEKK
jgi:TIR domain-containing protein